MVIIVGFRVVYVFDISQTEGEPLPPPPNWKSPEKKEKLAAKLVQFANGRGITVSELKLAGDVQGVSRGGAIEIDMSAGTATLIHEIAHELMHCNLGFPLNKMGRELEAEAVAYVVSKYFGLDSLSSPNYVALHGATSKSIFEHLDRIRSTATKIISYVENETK